MKYKYNGTDERELPSHARVVKNGDVFESETEINNPDFELVSGETKQPKVEVKPEVKQEEKKEEEKE